MFLEKDFNNFIKNNKYNLIFLTFFIISACFFSIRQSFSWESLIYVDSSILSILFLLLILTIFYLLCFLHYFFQYLQKNKISDIRCLHTKNKKPADWHLFGENNTFIAYVDKTSLKIKNGIASCILKIDLKNKSILDYTIFTYIVNFNNRKIGMVDSISVNKNGTFIKQKHKKTFVSFLEYSIANKDVNIIEYLINYFNIDLNLDNILQNKTLDATQNTETDDRKIINLITELESIDISGEISEADKEKFISISEKILKIDSNDVLILLLIASFYYLINDRDKVLEISNRVLLIDKNNKQAKKYIKELS